MVSSYRSVKLRCCEFNVPQQLLHRSQIGTPFEEVRRKRVTQSMRKRSGSLVNDTTNASRIEGSSTNTHPQAITSNRGCEHWAAQRQPSLYGQPRRTTHW